MNRQRLVSDLTRQAEQNLRNEERLAEWRRRYRARFGRSPASQRSAYAIAIRYALCPWLKPQHPAGSATVVKFPHYRGQYQRASLPTGPEAA